MRDLIYVAYAKCYCYAAVTNGHFSRMARLRRRLVTQWSTWRKRRSISSSLTCGPQTARILIPSITLSGVPFSREFITDENSRLWKNWSKQLSLNEKNLSQRLIDSCINEWRRRLEYVATNGGRHCNFVELQPWLCYSFSYVAVDWTVKSIKRTSSIVAVAVCLFC